MDFLTLEHHNSFQNQDSRKATYTFAPKPLIYQVTTRGFKIQWYLRE